MDSAEVKKSFLKVQHYNYIKILFFTYQNDKNIKMIG